MGEPAPPFGARDAVVIDRPSRHSGLELTVVAFADGEPRIRAYLHTREWKRILAVAFADRTPRIRAWLHTPGWERIVATGTGGAAGEAAVRAEDLLEAAWARGIPVALRRLRRVDAA